MKSAKMFMYEMGAHRFQSSEPVILCTRVASEEEYLCLLSGHKVLKYGRRITRQTDIGL